MHFEGAEHFCISSMSLLGGLPCPCLQVEVSVTQADQIRGTQNYTEGEVVDAVLIDPVDSDGVHNGTDSESMDSIVTALAQGKLQNDTKGEVEEAESLHNETETADTDAVATALSQSDGAQNDTKGEALGATEAEAGEMEEAESLQNETETEDTNAIANAPSQSDGAQNDTASEALGATGGGAGQVEEAQREEGSGPTKPRNPRHLHTIDGGRNTVTD